jgi:RNA polymerase-binding transcription factor DksA
MSALDDRQLQDLRARLDERAARLSAEIASIDAERQDSPARAPHDQVEDQGERGEHRLREAVRHAERERDAEELRDIGAARERMARGQYGQCIDCGTDIPPARLQAQPWAARCVACQELFERSHATGVRLPPVL